MESIYEYSARAGFWRLHRMMKDLPVTVYGVATDHEDVTTERIDEWVHEMTLDAGAYPAPNTCSSMR